MPQDQKPVDIPDTTTIATLDAFTIMAVCSCGHERELHSLFLRRQLGAGVTIAKVRASLRCHKCQARTPDIRIYRRQN